MQQPDAVRLHREEGEALIERLERHALTSEDRCVLVQLIRLYFWLLFALQEARCSLKRLRRLLFGEKRKKRQDGSRDRSSGSGEGDGPSAAGGGETPLGVAAGRQGAGGHRPGHGRQGAEGYVGAERVECRHETLAVGERCPVCGRGRLYRLPAGERGDLMATRWYRPAAMHAKSVGVQPVARYLPPNFPGMWRRKSTVRGRGRCWRWGAIIWGGRFIASQGPRPCWVCRGPRPPSGS